jgi:hypothetical protein
MEDRSTEKEGTIMKTATGTTQRFLRASGTVHAYALGDEA